MIINDKIFQIELLDILETLKYQLNSNGINMFHKFVDSGEDIMVCCPYHKDGQERRPSAGIRKSDGLFHCFACDETHSLPEVISHCLGHTSDTFGKLGMKWLIQTFNVVSVEEREDVDIDCSRDSVRSVKRVDYISDDELNSYRFYHPYMYERKLTDDVIELFDIGYDKSTQCITFPIRDITGGTLFVARRSVNTKFFNYPSGAEKPLYGIYELSMLKEFPKEIIVCESMLDALTCWTYGKFAVALNGLGNELQFEQLRKLPCRHIILATDNDDAGRKARARIRKNITNKVITEYVLPIGKKDINELTKQEFLALEEIL